MTFSICPSSPENPNPSERRQLRKRAPSAVPKDVRRVTPLASSACAQHMKKSIARHIVETTAKKLRRKTSVAAQKFQNVENVAWQAELAEREEREGERKSNRSLDEKGDRLERICSQPPQQRRGFNNFERQKSPCLIPRPVTSNLNAKTKPASCYK